MYIAFLKKFLHVSRDVEYRSAIGAPYERGNKLLPPRHANQDIAACNTSDLFERRSLRLRLQMFENFGKQHEIETAIGERKPKQVGLAARIAQRG